MKRPRRLSGLVLTLAVAACGSSSSKAWRPPPAEIVPEPPPTAASSVATTPTAAPAAPAAGTSPAARPSSIPGALPVDVAGVLAAHASCANKECALPGLFPPLPGLDAAGPAAVWSHELTAVGNAVTVPRHVEVHVYGVVVRGSARIAGSEGGKSLVAGPWTAFRAPGAGVSVAAAEAGTRVVLAAVTGGGAVADAAAKLRDGAAKVGWKTRPEAIASVDLNAAKDLSWGGGAMHARIGFEGAGQPASLGVLMASKDAPVAQHQHDTSWEILVVLRAAGTAKRASGPGAQAALADVPVVDGSVVSIAKATQHAWIPSGDRPLVAIQLYVPAGPEQRFKALAEAK